MRHARAPPLTEIAFAALFGLQARRSRPVRASRRSWACCSRTDPGAISAQGAKGAVSADGPESPERVQLNKALVGFLTHTGYAHGGNGFEGIAFLIEQFKDGGLTDPGDPAHGLDLKAMAARSVERLRAVQGQRKKLPAASTSRSCPA